MIKVPCLPLLCFQGSPVRLFLGNSRVDEDLKKHLRPDCAGQKFEYFVDESSQEGADAKTASCPSEAVVIEEYEVFYPDLRKIVDADKDAANPAKLWISSHANHEIFRIIPSERKILEPAMPLKDWKAIKNPTETAGMKSAHIKDALALVKFAAEMEKVVMSCEAVAAASCDPASLWTESDVAARLKEFRLQEADSRGESFPTIAGYDANGAIIHYNPANNDEPALVKPGGMLLLDSGGQYLDGTTDVTRTFHYGTPTQYQKESYTRVLMGQLNLAMAVIPEGVVTGNELQVIRVCVCMCVCKCVCECACVHVREQPL